MTILETVDELDYNEMLIALEQELLKDPHNKKILIREVFLLWYILAEGIHPVDFPVNKISALLKARYLLVVNMFKNDADFTFIIGWMMSVAPWYLSEDCREDDAIPLLYISYKSNTKNNLWKWALRGEMRLTENEVQKLAKGIKRNFSSYFDYGKLIRDYFLDLI